MPKRYFSLDEATYFCHICHKETRDTGRGEGQLGFCWMCYSISEIENIHFDLDHAGDFGDCSTCKEVHLKEAQIKHLPYYLGEKSYPTI